MKSFTLLFTIAILASCSRNREQASDTLASANLTTLSDSTKSSNNKTENNTGMDAWKLDNYLTDEISDTTSVQRVSSDCAILIYPTDDQIDELTRENGEEDFATIADDSNYYQSTAIDQLDSAGVKTVTANRHYVNLVGENKSWLLDIRRKGGVTWGIILFNKTKQPEIVSAIDLTKERIKQYFDKKP